MSSKLPNYLGNCLVFTWTVFRKSVMFIDVSYWSTKMVRSFSSILTLPVFWVAFKICRACSILPPAFQDGCRLPKTFSDVLFPLGTDVCPFDFFSSINFEFKLSWAISACSLTIALFVTSSVFFWGGWILWWCGNFSESLSFFFRDNRDLLIRFGVGSSENNTRCWLWGEIL